MNGSRGMHRRGWLARSALSLALAGLPWRIARASGSMTPAMAGVPKPPLARVDVAHDTYFGETIADPYRWMEDGRDPDWLAYLRAQNDYARYVFDRLPKREALAARIRSLSGDAVATTAATRAGTRLFFQQRAAGADNYRLLVREKRRDRVLVDPAGIHAPGVGHFSLDWWQPSRDGRWLVYGLSKDGSENSVLHVIDVDTGRELPERIVDADAAEPQWLDDSSGFFYTQLTSPPDTPERYLDAQLRFHRLGSDPAADPVIMKRGLDPAVIYDRIQMPHARTFANCDHMVLELADVRNEKRAMVAPIAAVLEGRARWVAISSFEDELIQVELNAGRVIALVNGRTPRGRIVSMPIEAPDLEQATQIAAQGPEVIESFVHARDGIYLQLMDGGLGRLRRIASDGHANEIRLPFDCTIGALDADLDHDGALFNLSGWLEPTTLREVDAKGRVRDTGVTPKPRIDVSAYETRSMLVTVRDGTRVPVSLIHRRGLKLDGSHPTFIQAYGSYGLPAYTPSFASRSLALIDAGFIVGYASVRGGGEYGREWHKAGQLENKPNTWRDLIDCCEFLCRRGYTSPSRLAIGGRSAGGITVGRAMTERPDLFAAVIDGVGWSNPLRYVVEQNGFGEEPEWGAIDDPAGYKALKSIDSYQSVVDGAAYPAVLLTTGVTDPRVAPFHAGKMAARLQAASSSGKPVLLRVDFDAGHGMGSTRSQVDREYADTYAFLLAFAGTAKVLK